jgi:hypothetical protein
MDELKSRIKEEKIETLSAQPLPGHRDRFEQKLSKKKTFRLFGPGNPLWMYAAAASLLLLIGTFAWNWNLESKKNESVEMFDNGQKFAAMEHYFNTKLQDDKDLKSSEDSLVKVYIIDLKKLELQQQELESKLSENYGNEKIINAIIANYKMRLSIMERLRRYIKIKNLRNEKSNQEYQSI